MGDYRNPELRRELLIYSTGTVIFSGLGFFIHLYAGFLSLVFGVFFILTHLYFSRDRYKTLANMSHQIDEILHGNHSLWIADNVEGEFSILQSEIQKMTLRLKESTDMLLTDKVRLTEAIADIFHQLRTPLTSLNLIASLLSDENLPFDRRITLTRELKRQLHRMEWLVETLLKISKIDSGTALIRSDTVSVKEVIKKAIHPLEILMELQGQTLELKVAEETFTGDLMWTVEALGNILKNSVEHTQKYGTVRVSAQETALYTEIQIEDNGIGFDKEDLPHLFERFYRGKSSKEENIGIGLALSRMIIAAQNGVVSAENNENGGAKFIIRFYKGII